ncbi:DUF5681 domain-containing protein [Methylobacterium sp. NFXW15]|uniref:DUF5681 domain-containing protein n=1 Tax=Methylobacterium sp. NFXW15 TaxID=2819512 RepID=UPI003CF076A2
MARKQNEPDACKARGFQKGRSGNPKGRPPIIREVQEMAKELTPALISNLFEIATNDKANASARVQASVALLDRGWGRPKQSVDVKVDHNASGLAAAIAAAQDRMRVNSIPQQATDIIEGEIIATEPVASKPGSL